MFSMQARRRRQPAEEVGDFFGDFFGGFCMLNAADLAQFAAHLIPSPRPKFRVVKISSPLPVTSRTWLTVTHHSDPHTQTQTHVERRDFYHKNRRIIWGGYILCKTCDFSATFCHIHRNYCNKLALLLTDALSPGAALVPSGSVTHREPASGDINGRHL